jgi:hypothetical protein
VVIATATDCELQIQPEATLCQRDFFARLNTFAVVGYRTATAMAGSPRITDITWQTYLRCRRDDLAVMARRRLRQRKGCQRSPTCARWSPEGQHRYAPYPVASRHWRACSRPGQADEALAAHGNTGKQPRPEAPGATCRSRNGRCLDIGPANKPGWGAGRGAPTRLNELRLSASPQRRAAKMLSYVPARSALE